MPDPLFLQPTIAQDLYSWALGSAYRQFRLFDPSYALARDPLIYEKLSRDPKFASAARYRQHLVAGRAWTIEPASDSVADKLLAKVLTALVKRVKNFASARFNLAGAVIRGSAWAFLQGGQEERVQIAGLPTMPWYIFNHLQDVDRRRMHYRPTRDSKGNTSGTRLVWFSVKRRRWEAVDPSWFVLNAYDDTEQNLGYGLGLIDACYFFMWFKESLLNEALKAAKRWSAGIVTVQVDSLRDSAGNVQKRVTDWQNAVLAQRDRDALIFDKADTIDLKFPSGTGVEIILKMIEYADRAIQELLTGSTLGQSSGPDGVRAGDSSVHQQATESLIQYDRELEQGAITSGLLHALVRYNRPNLKVLGLDDAQPGNFTIAEEKIVDPAKAMETIEKALQAKIPLRKIDVHENIGYPIAGEDEEVYDGGSLGADPNDPNAPSPLDGAEDPEAVLTKLFGPPARTGATPPQPELEPVGAGAPPSARPGE